MRVGFMWIAYIYCRASDGEYYIRFKLGNYDKAGIDTMVEDSRRYLSTKKEPCVVLRSKARVMIRRLDVESYAI